MNILKLLSTISNFMNDMTGDVDVTFDVKIKGRGFGSIFNNWNGNNNVTSFHGYTPYSPISILPITAEQY